MVTFAYTSPWNIFSGVYGLIIKRTKQILKIWPPHFTVRLKEIDCVTENSCTFFFLIDTKHSSSLGTIHQAFGIKLLTSTFWNRELISWLLILCQWSLERKEFVWIVHLYDIYINWISSNSYTCHLDNQNWDSCIDKWVTANTYQWKYPWILKSHWVLRQDHLYLLVATYALENAPRDYGVFFRSSSFLQLSACCEGMSITRALHVFFLKRSVPSPHYTRTVISHHSCTPQYSIEEIFFNIYNKLPTPGVSYSHQVLLTSLAQENAAS